VDIDKQVWTKARVGYSTFERPIVQVPVLDSVFVAMNHKRVKTDLIFSKLEDGTVESFLLLAVADSAYHVASGGNYSLGNFTGSFSFFDLDFNHKKSILVRNGVPTAGTDTLSIKTESAVVPRECVHIEITTNIPCGDQNFSQEACSMKASYWVCSTDNPPPPGGPTGSGGSGGFNIGGSSGGSDSPTRIYGTGSITPPTWDWWKGDANTTWLDALLLGVPLHVFQEWNANSGYTNTFTGQAQMVYELAQTIGLTKPEHLTWLAGRPALVEDILGIFKEAFAAGLTEKEKIRMRLHIERVIDFVLTSKIKVTDAEIMMLILEQKIFGSIKSCFDEENGSEFVREYLKDVIRDLSSNTDFVHAVNASYGWPPFMWEIGKELLGNAAIKVVKSAIPGWDEGHAIVGALRGMNEGDLIKTGKNLLKFISGVLLKGNPATAGIKIAWRAGKFAYKISSSLDKIDKLTDKLSEDAIKRGYNILKKMNFDLFDIDDLGKYVKYVDDLKTPKLGNKFATKSTYRDNFRGMFPEVKGQIEEVHHAFPQVLFDNQDRYGYLGITTDQMHSFENLRGVSKTLHDQLDAHWTTWLRNNTPPVSQHFPTFNEIKDFAKYLDDLYGSSLVPPIR
jgi:hypothetical protein